MTQPRASASVRHKDGFSVTTRLNASPDALYRAWTEKSGLEGWLATEAEVDLCVGGRYIYRWPSPDGELSARGEYKELLPGRKLVQTWESWGPEGRYEDGDALLTVEFDERSDGTVEMTQSERSDVYADPARMEMSINGTIAAHKALVDFIGS